MAETSWNTEQGPSVAGCLPAVGDVLPRFCPVPPATDRALWTGLDPEWAARLAAEGEAALGTDWPALSSRAYRAFTQTGDRAGYEAAYFARRRKLNALALAEAVTAEGRFVDALIDGIYLICEESGWQLPAHNAQTRGGPRAPLANPARPVIDLFAAETGAQLAMLAHLLGETLDAVSPEIVARIDHEIESRITRPYLEKHFWWMGDGDAPMNNWTAWCTQNVLISTFARPTSQPVRHAVLKKAAHSLDAFLKDYGEDGACEEGALYYRHAALCLFGALSVMEAAAPRAFAPLWQTPKIRNMADFIVNMHVAGDTYINFADSSAVLDPCGAREFLFGKAVGSEALSNLAAGDARGNPRPDLPEEINLTTRLLALATAKDMARHTTAPVVRPDIYYPSCGLFVARDATFVVAAKAGDNGEGHNHNDVGNVIVFKNGRPLLIDIGVETYTAKTFSPERYEIWTMQSGFHNLPRFGGVDQEAGSQFAARDVDVTMNETAPSIGMDISGAYPETACVSSYRRTVTLKKGEAVEIDDICMAAQPVELSLMMSQRPELADGRILLGELGEIALTGAWHPRVEEIAVTDPRLRQAWPARIYRVLVPVENRELRLRIT